MGKVENGLSRAFTLGLAGKESGKLDQGQLKVKFHIKGDFKRGEGDDKEDWVLVGKNTGGEDPLVDAKIEFGSSPGLNQMLINMGMGVGGVEQAFFNGVWPALVKMIPVNLGTAMEVVPADAGGISHLIKIKGICATPDHREHNKRCDSLTHPNQGIEELRLNISHVTKMSVTPKPVMEKYMQVVNDNKKGDPNRAHLTQGTGEPEKVFETMAEKAEAVVMTEETETMVESTIKNVLAAYGQNKPVFKDLKYDGSVALSIGKDKQVVVDAGVDVALPLGFTQGVIGESLQKTLEDFIPSEGALGSHGKLTLKNGVLDIPETQFTKVRLPIVIGKETEALELSATLSGFKMEQVQAASEAPSMVFGQDRRIMAGADGQLGEMTYSKMCSVLARAEPGMTPEELKMRWSDLESATKDPPLGVDMPGFEIKLDRSSGLSANFNPKLKATVDGAYVKKSLDTGNGPPTNPRVEAISMSTLEKLEGEERFSKADSMVPKKFQRPAARMPSKLNLAEVLQEFDATVHVSLEGSEEASWTSGKLEEKLEVTITTSVETKLRFGYQFWKGILDSSDTDLGYIHFSAVGTVGPLQGGGKKEPSQAALLMISCGTLEIFDINKPKDTPFENEPSISRDILRAGTELNLAGEEKHVKKLSSSTSCFQVDTQEHGRIFMKHDKDHYFCAETPVIDELIEAVRIQHRRFGDVAATKALYPASFSYPQCCEDGYKDKNPEHCKVMHPNLCSDDGTWFKALNPKDPTTFYPTAFPPELEADVTTPRQQWRDAVQKLQTLQKLPSDETVETAEPVDQDVSHYLEEGKKTFTIGTVEWRCCCMEKMPTSCKLVKQKTLRKRSNNWLLQAGCGELDEGHVKYHSWKDTCVVNQADANLLKA